MAESYCNGLTMIDAYREWLFSVIDFHDNCYDYAELLDYLSGKQFRWTVKHDINRNDDGLALRHEFADALGYESDWYDGYLPKEASVLEVMIALARRIDEIIYDPDQGDQTSFCFWEMVKNLGLSEMKRPDFDRDYCEEIVERLLKRRYEKNGKGALFSTEYSDIDFRKAEIWYQMQQWIEENFVI